MGSNNNVIFENKGERIITTEYLNEAIRSNQKITLDSSTFHKVFYRFKNRRNANKQLFGTTSFPRGLEIRDMDPLRFAALVSVYEGANISRSTLNHVLDRTNNRLDNDVNSNMISDDTRAEIYESLRKSTSHFATMTRDAIRDINIDQQNPTSLVKPGGVLYEYAMNNSVANLARIIDQNGLLDNGNEPGDENESNYSPEKLSDLITQGPSNFRKKLQDVAIKIEDRAATREFRPRMFSINKIWQNLCDKMFNWFQKSKKEQGKQVFEKAVEEAIITDGDTGHRKAFSIGQGIINHNHNNIHNRTVPNNASVRRSNSGRTI